MKPSFLFAAATACCFSACETMNAPITGGDFNPLSAPGANRRQEPTGNSGFSPGQYVSTGMDNTAFFLKRPSGNADADKMLKVNTRVKVVASDNSYVKVELDSGEVGYVSPLMLVDPNAPAAVIPGSPGEVQVYPPLPHGGVDSVPIVPPSEAPPGGAIPSVIDPAAPPNEVPAAPPESTGVAPVTPPVTPPAEAPKEAPAGN